VYGGNCGYAWVTVGCVYGVAGVGEEEGVRRGGDEWGMKWL